MDFSKYYTLTYRLKTHPQALTMFFRFEGKPGENEISRLQSAVLRGRVFCDNMSYNFHSVFPMISDLDAIEKRRLIRDGMYVEDKPVALAVTK